MREAKTGIKSIFKFCLLRLTGEWADNSPKINLLCQVWAPSEPAHQNASLHFHSHSPRARERRPGWEQAYEDDSLGESCTECIRMVCFLPLDLGHNFSPQRNHLLLWLWHLKSFPHIAGDCSCGGGFSGCSVAFKKKKIFFWKKCSQTLELCLVLSKLLCSLVRKYLKTLEPQMEFSRRHTELISFAWCYPEKSSCQCPEEQALQERWWPKPGEAGKIKVLILPELLPILPNPSCR